MAAKGTTQWEKDEEEAERKADAERQQKARDAAAAKSGGKKDPMDPASAPGNTGNSPKLGPGVKKRPTEAEDEEAKEQAKTAAATADAELGEGSYRKASQVEAKAIVDGASLLGKEAVVVQDDQGHPRIAVRGLPETAKANASATNPALAANNAIPPPADGPADEAAQAKAEEDGMVIVPLHGSGPQPAAG